jgi:hypothetical protein
MGFLRAIDVSYAFTHALEGPKFLDGNLKIVTPVRHPHAAFNSFLKRGRKGKNMEHEWETLIRVTGESDTYFVPIDCAESKRMDLMTGLCDFLGVQMNAEGEDYVRGWRRRNHCDGPPLVSAGQPDLGFAVDWYIGKALPWL